MNFTQSEKEFIRASEAYIPMNDSDRPVFESEDELREYLDERRRTAAAQGGSTKPDFRNAKFIGLDLAGWDMTGLSLDHANFENCNLNGADFSDSDMDHVAFYNNDLRNMKLRGCMARGCSFRFQDMEGIDISGADIYASVLEDAINPDKVIYDDDTRWYRMTCPEEGPFIGWKCCTDLRVVMMLIPADAKRCMATLETGRASKVKVLKITSIDETENFTWAQSTVDQDFYYEVGKWTEPANGFQEDRWKDSSPGIHFFLDRQQCIDYQSK